MHIIRPIASHDEQALLGLALSATPGILTLPRDPERIKQKLADSVKAFSSSDFSEDNRYIFVLENLETHQIEGCSGILKSINQDTHYKIEVIENNNRLLNYIPPIQKLLRPQISNENISEIGTLFLSKNCRKSGLGRLLSMSRFLFVACFPEFFEKEFMAEMRGVVDPTGKSPFWEGVGRHFYDVDFETISAIYEANPKIVKEILPTYPIYWSLLAQETQDAIGKTHPDTVPALKMLESQGFSKCDWIDIIDGGPRVRAVTSEIQIIKTATHASVTQIIKDNLADSSVGIRLISNRKRDFRACYGIVIVDEHGVTIDANTAKKLEIEKEEMICFSEEKK
ncbi:MAG: arginine N-succinyltransferase [Parachlamydiaceae bacterium]|nr:arginine N-succinyltransferase [Parachlamydiaceae bacterium]